jgi:hypothetical protein
MLIYPNALDYKAMRSSADVDNFTNDIACGRWVDEQKDYLSYASSFERSISYDVNDVLNFEERSVLLSSAGIVEKQCNFEFQTYNELNKKNHTKVSLSKL